MDECRRSQHVADSMKQNDKKYVNLQNTNHTSMIEYEIIAWSIDKLIYWSSCYTRATLAFNLKTCLVIYHYIIIIIIIQTVDLLGKVSGQESRVEKCGKSNNHLMKCIFCQFVQTLTEQIPIPYQSECFRYTSEGICLVPQRIIRIFGNKKWFIHHTIKTLYGKTDRATYHVSWNLPFTLKKNIDIYNIYSVCIVWAFSKCFYLELQSSLDD